ncbi:GDP-mannose 4,6-dehydratase [candidate division KSB1 bacterium]|nr:GDP-mannose 4,6-dehydratase [candidate division KSB1 bacterium]
MQRVLVTGGAGFIGSHLSATLLEQGCEVICLDSFNDYYDPGRKRRNVEELQRHTNYKLLEHDILDLDFLKNLFREGNFDVVVHLAARAGVRPSIQEPLLYQKVNVEGTNNLLEMSKVFGVEKFIFASSSSVYGENKKVPFCEDDLVDHPISPYAATKKAGELLCYTYHHLYKLPVTCLRFFTVYGPRQRPDMAIHKFTRGIYFGNKITMYGDGTTQRDYTFISDIIDGICRSIDNCHSYHIYNLGESQTIKLVDLITLISKCLGKQPDIDRLPMQPGDVPITYADISRPRAELGYNPEVEIEEGVGRFVKWFVETINSR